MRIRIAALGAVALLATGCVTVERVDTSADGTATSAGVATFAPGIADSAAGISGDGRFVVFASTGADLVPGVTDGKAHVYRKDRATGAIAIADVSATGTPSEGAVADAISADGTRVSFRTVSRLTGNDEDDHLDVYVRDFKAGTTVLASLMPDGSQTPVNNGVGTGAQGVSAFDGTGTKLFFLVGTGNIPPRNLLEVRDLSASTTTQVLGDSEVTDVIVSHDGKHLASNTGCFQVGGCFPEPVLVDRSVAYPFTPTFDSGARTAGLSDDGRYLLYETGSSEDDARHIPVRYDRTTGTTVRLGVGTATPSSVEVRALDGSGRFAVVTAPDDAIEGGTAGHVGLFLVDITSGYVERTSADAANRAGNGTSEGAVVRISRDGRTVGFFSSATNLVGDDTNGAHDAFVRVGPTPVIQTVSGGTVHRGASHVQVTLLGAEFLNPLFVSISGDGVTVHSVSVSTANDRAMLDVSVAANAPTGVRTLTVANLAAVGHAGTVCSCIAIS